MFEHRFLILDIHTFQFRFNFFMEIVKGLGWEKIHIEIADIFLLKIQRLFLAVHFDDPHPFIHFFLGHFIVGFPSHHLLLLFRQDINFPIFFFFHSVDKVGKRGL